MAKMTREEVKERSLRDFRSGRAIDEICKEYGVAERSLYMWNNVFGCVLSQCGRDEEQAYKIWIKMKRPRPSAKEIELLKTCDEVRREIRVQDDMFRECVMLGLVQQYHEGKSVTELSKESGIARSTIYYWIKRTEPKKKAGNKSIATQKEYEQLLVHSKRLQDMLDILRKYGCTPLDPLQERLEILEQLYHTKKYSVRLLCEALEVPRGTFYNHIFRNKRGESSYEKRKEELRIQIRDVYEESNQIFGAPKIAAVLQNEGVKVSSEYVRKLMREMGLESIRNGAKKQYMDETRKTQNIVNREFSVDKPNQVWVSDVTYFKLNEMKFYICVIMDLFARKVIAYRVGKNNSTQLVKGTFKDAYETRNVREDLIFHTDQGSNYRARAFSTYLAERNVTQSFSKAGVPYDNSVMESFFASMKREELYRYKYRSEKEFRARVDEYINFYNCKRPHKTLKYKTPEQVEQKFLDTARV